MDEIPEWSIMMNKPAIKASVITVLAVLFVIFLVVLGFHFPALVVPAIAILFATAFSVAIIAIFWLEVYSHYELKEILKRK